MHLRANTRRAWRTLADPPSIARQRTSTQPGDCVSIDQMESPVLGLVAQMKGVPMKDRYNSATVFIEHFSDVTFVHMQKSANAAETLEVNMRLSDGAILWCSYPALSC
jgi:hypothetical protein